ncbi:MAG: MBL fold metallo-hydrolase [Candidatus Zixiibacteriota bacterium]|nr:MAG: MBL fold metallo-hydrolase [candidate division Zixibacteria bacterium]
MPKQLKALVLGPFAVNCYLYWDGDSGDGVIIDPGADGDQILAAVRSEGFKPRAILLTHGHIDHIAAVEQVKNSLKLPLYIGDGDQALLDDPMDNGSAFFGIPVSAPQPDRCLADEEVITFGTVSLRVLATPGHSIGSVCYLDETAGNLFCGDALFAGSIGRTDLPGGSLEQLLKSIRAKILGLPDSVVCYPGHGPSTTVGTERVSNPFLVGGAFA